MDEINNLVELTLECISEECAIFVNKDGDKFAVPKEFSIYRVFAKDGEKPSPNFTPYIKMSMNNTVKKFIDAMHHKWKDEIKESIDRRVKEHDTIKCLYSVLLLNSNEKKELENLITKYGHEIRLVDDVSGAWNLNENFYEFEEESCIEYNGTYPVNWDIDDIVKLVSLYKERSIYIQIHQIVYRHGEPEYIPNY